MKFLPLNNFINDITPGSSKDDAQYLSLYIHETFQEFTRTKGGLRIAKIETTSKDIYYLVLEGKVNILDPEGESIKTSEEYICVIGESPAKDYLHFNTMAFIKIVDERGEPGNIENVFFNVKDCLDYLEGRA